ncbi:hypothetical protein DFH08DRAFT_978695, partial [Mycena albidolilacea]
MGKRGKKRERRRVPKEERKNLRLWAEGARENILAPHIDAYTAALNQGWRPERKFLKIVCNEFHARVSWKLPDHEEPILEEWDPAAIVTEEDLSEEDEKRKRARIKELNARIRRWFVYRIRRIRKHRRTAGLDPTKDPFAVLLAKLSGLSAPLKARQAFQQFMREKYDDSIAPVVAAQWEEERNKASAITERTKEPKAGFRAQVARDLFAELPADEQKMFGDRAKKEAQEAKAACIGNLHEFMGPILQGIHAYTGLHATLIVGGPIPVQGGELGTLHFSYGRNKTALAQHWGQWDKPRFTTNVQNFMVDYLKTAYTAQDCIDTALANTVDFSAAKYTIDAARAGDSDLSDSDSDSDNSESDTDTDSDEEDAARTRKKRKLDGLQPSTSKSKSKAPTKRKKSTSSSDPTASAPSSTPVPPGPSTSAPAALGTAPSNDDRSDEDQDRELPSDPWHLSEDDRQANIRRNQALLQAIKDDFAALATDVRQSKKQKPALKKPRMKDTPLEPTRRSSRHTTSASATDPPSLSTLPAPSLSTLPPPSSSASPALSSSTPLAPSSSAPPALPSSTPPVPSSVPPTPSAHPAGSPSLLPPVSQAVQVAMAAAPAHTGSLLLGPCPPNAPAWFVDARSQMTRITLGCHFDALLAGTRIEDASRFEQGPTNLSHKGRPKQVGNWVAGSRGKKSYDASIPNLAEYA